jgi:hypothetical protein
MSDFPEIEPFGPRPTTRHDSGEGAGEHEKTGENAIQSSELPAVPPQNSSYALTVITAFGLGVAVGYLLFRHQESILRQTKLDQFLDYANVWVREQSPRLTDPIRQGIESTGSTFGQAFKSTGSNLDDLIKKVKTGFRRAPSGWFDRR